MPENPYRAPQTPSPAGSRFNSIRVAGAIVMTLFGVLTGFLAAHHLRLLFSGPGPARDIAAYGFPSFTLAAIGGLLSAVALARGQMKLATAGFVFFLLGSGGWFLFLYAVMAGWFH